MVDGLDALEVLDAGRGVELGGAELERLLALALGRGEYNYFVAQLGCELDCEVAEAADAHDPDSVAGLQTFMYEGAPGKDGVLVLRLRKERRKEGRKELV